MNRDELQHQLRVVLSWREQAWRAQAEASTAAAEGRMDAEQFSFDQSSLDAHRIAAETHLEDLRRQIGGHLTGLGQQLQETLQMRGHVVRQAAAGILSAAEANRENRRIVERIEALRSEIQTWNHLLHAGAPEELGGFKELPLEEYAPKVNVAKPRAMGGFWNENRVTLVLAALVLVLGISGILYFRVWRDAVAFQAFLPTAAGQPLLLECHNTTLDTVTWYVPWGSATDVGSHAFGVNLLLREKGSEEFRLFTPTQPVWTFEGTPTDHADPIQVPSGLSMRVSLDVALLKELAPNANAMLVVCTGAGGAIRFSVALDPL